VMEEVVMVVVRGGLWWLEVDCGGWRWIVVVEWLVRNWFWW
jgi:hypothetical protein